MEMASGVGQQRAVMVMFENEREEGLKEVYKPLGERQRSLPVLMHDAQEPVNLVKTEVDLESDLDRSAHSVRQSHKPVRPNSSKVSRSLSMADAQNCFSIFIVDLEKLVRGVRGSISSVWREEAPA